MKTINMNCYECGKVFELKKKEYNRQVKKGRSHFFCSLSCAATHGNNKRPDKTYVITRECPICGKEFQTRTGSKTATFCSRGCASKGSMTFKRWNKAVETGKIYYKKNALGEAKTIAKGLRKREWWKYEDLHELLDILEYKHEFEHPIQPYIYDLVLFDLNLIVEFDSKYHNLAQQKKVDIEKTKIAEAAGFKVKRIKTKMNEKINAKRVRDILGL